MNEILTLIAIILLGLAAFKGAYDTDKYKKQLKDCEEAYKDLCKRYNKLKNA